MHLSVANSCLLCGDCRPSSVDKVHYKCFIEHGILFQLCGATAIFIINLFLNLSYFCISFLCVLNETIVYVMRYSHTSPFLTNSDTVRNFKFLKNQG